MTTRATATPGLGRSVLFALTGLVLACGAARAEVHLGKGVFIAGHDFSNRRASVIHIERVRKLRGPLGCRHVRHGSFRRADGTLVTGPMEECNLIAKRPPRQ